MAYPQHMFLWGTEENYLFFITKYPHPFSLTLCQSLTHVCLVDSSVLVYGTSPFLFTLCYDPLITIFGVKAKIHLEANKNFSASIKGQLPKYALGLPKVEAWKSTPQILDSGGLDVHTSNFGFIK